MAGAVISLVNMKGGVGKTTLTVNLAGVYAYCYGLKTLVVDLDPQANASIYLMGSMGYREFLESGRGSIVNIFEESLENASPEQLIHPVAAWWAKKNLDLIPSRLELSWALKNADGKEYLLVRFLERVREAYGYVIIDCPPMESILTTAAYMATDSLVVPVVPEYLATIGLPLLAKSVNEFEQRYGKRLCIWIVFNSTGSNYSEYEKSKIYVERVAKEHGWEVLENEVRFSRSYQKGSRQQTPIFLTDYARWCIRDEFRHVAREVFAATAPDDLFDEGLKNDWW